MACELSPLSEHTGVEAKGVDLSRPLDEATREKLNRAFIDYSVLVVRDQTLTATQLHAAVRNFGEIFPQHNTRFALPECPEIHYLSNKDRYPDGTRYIPGAGYHTDHSNSETPPKATLPRLDRILASSSELPPRSASSPSFSSAKAFS